METPPRTWRRRTSLTGTAGAPRNTSTDVEKTTRVHLRVRALQKHLHGRGEDSDRWIPRRQTEGNTSTDVEKTEVTYGSHGKTEKHLHGRGEDATRLVATSTIIETPPRTWRRLRDFGERCRHCGNTSTDVEKTSHRASRTPARWKHLHGRGEDVALLQLLVLQLETPPRTWRRPYISKPRPQRSGNTSTDVEKTA